MLLSKFISCYSDYSTIFSGFFTVFIYRYCGCGYQLTLRSLILLSWQTQQRSFLNLFGWGIFIVPCATQIFFDSMINQPILFPLSRASLALNPVVLLLPYLATTFFPLLYTDPLLNLSQTHVPLLFFTADSPLSPNDFHLLIFPDCSCDLYWFFFSSSTKKKLWKR